jgi:iron complex outermembrane recepter protein
MQKYFVLLCLLYSSLVFGQSNNGDPNSEIKGKIVSTNEVGVVYAAVSLIQNKTTIIKSVITNVNGEFELNNILPGNYSIRIDHIEHEPYTTELFEVYPNQIKVFDKIILKTMVNNLDEVIVSHKKAIIEVKADKLIFNVSSSPSASGTNGLDLLKKSPGVTIGMDNSISLIGKGNVQVYLNGVPSRLSGTDLTNFLQSLTSDVIDSIEIISNPSSKYEAEGTGGIINIRMKKNVATGFNGNASSSFTQGRELRYSNNVSLNYGNEKLKVNFDFTPSYDNNWEGFIDNKQQNGFLLELNSIENQIRKGYNTGLGFDYQLTKKHTLGVTLRGIFNTNDNELNSTTNISEGNPPEFTEILASQSILDGKSTNFTTNLNHLWTTSKTISLNTSASFGVYDSDRSTSQPNTYFLPDGETEISSEDFAFDAKTDITLWSIKTDFTKEWEKVTLSSGAKYAQIVTDNQFAFYDILDDTPILDLTKSNDFLYTENVAAVYVNLDLTLSKSVMLNTGLRMENTASRGQLVSDVPLDNKDVKRNYTDFFPNIGLLFDNQSNHSVSLNLGRRITRPNYQDLNPFETPISQLTVWKGNPFLNPNYSMNYQASYSYKKKLIITTSYTETTDFFSRIVEVLDDDASQIIPRNLDSETNLAIGTSYSLKVNKIWDFILFANASKKTYNGDAEGTIINIDANLWDYQIQNNINLPKDILVDITFRQRSEWVWRGSVFIEGTYGLSFGIRKEFLNKTLQIRVTGSDILGTESDYPYYSDYGGLLLNGVYRADNRRFGLGATYKFGNQKAKTKRNNKNALDEELNRIGN